MIKEIHYEYAGFKYRFWWIGDHWVAEPMPGQHHAAYKDKHRRAAIEQWQSEGCPGRCDE